MSFADVAAAARRAASAWKARGVGRGDLVVLVGTHPPDLYACWLGAVWLGAVPTILAEPSVRIDAERYRRRLAALLERNDARHLALDPQYSGEAPWPAGVGRSSYEEIAAGSPGTVVGEPPEVDPGDLLLLQHSSGTTGLQKGVMLSHGAVAAHAEDYAAALGLTDDDVVVSWLPLYHDMGFIACFLLPLARGVPVVWLSPFEWVANPALLLEAASAERATLAWLPNFAYPFLAQRVRELADDVDLSSLRAVINCSEPVTGEAFDPFAKRFTRHGLRPEALHTCYAMAENVFAVTTSSPDAPPHRLAVDRETWFHQHQAVETPEGSTDAVHLLSSGLPLPRCRVRIARPDGTEAERGEVGRVLIRSPFLFDGYFRRPDLDEGLFDGDGFYDTGDLGFVDRTGHLYVTGRAKDLIIVGGRNVYPQDVEAVVAEVEGVVPGRVVCFGVAVEALGTEGLVVLAESETPEEEWRRLARRIRGAVPAQLDLDLVDVRIAPRGSLSKSTSGKLARAGNRDAYLAGRFGAPTAGIALE